MKVLSVAITALVLSGCAQHNHIIHEPLLRELSADKDPHAVTLLLETYTQLLQQTGTTPEGAENLEILTGMLKSEDVGVRSEAAVVIGLYGKAARSKLPDLHAAYIDTKQRLCGMTTSGVWPDGALWVAIERIEGKGPPPYECTSEDIAQRGGRWKYR